MDKFFKTYKEQRQILVKRGLAITHPRRFDNIMKSDEYYNIINGYKKHFITGTAPERYIAGVTFEQLYSLYLFDQDLRLQFLGCLLKIEKKLKALIAYHFSECYGHDHRQYLVAQNFDCSSTRNQNHAIKLITKINRDIVFYANRGSSAIAHYTGNYGYVPLWVLNTIMSFGRVVHFYSCMKLVDQQKICKHFNLPASALSGFLYFLNDLRNICAHGGRIYTPNNHGTYINHIPDTAYHTTLGIPKNTHGNYIYGKCDVMAMMIAFKTFLKPSDFTKTKRFFEAKEAALAQKIPSPIMRNIEKEMGCPFQFLAGL